MPVKGRNKGAPEVGLSLNSRIEEGEYEETTRREKRSQSPYEFQATQDIPGGLYRKVHREIKRQLMRQSSSQSNFKRDSKAGKIERVRNFSKNKRIIENSFHENKPQNYVKNGAHSFGSSRSQSAHRSFLMPKRSPPTRETSRFTNKMESLIQEKAEYMLLDPK